MKHVQGTPWEDVLGQKSLDENLNILPPRGRCGGIRARPAAWCIAI